MLLVHFLRDELGLTGTRATPRTAACVVLYDDEPVKSCTVLAPWRRDTTSRPSSLEVDGVLDPVQRGFMECHGLQCGFCTPGMLLTRGLLDRSRPERRRSKGHLGQICRCTGYATIVRSVRWAAQPRGSRTIW
jgi:carbon-monoxide dehydrogenase small subunit